VTSSTCSLLAIAPEVLGYLRYRLLLAHGHHCPLQGPTDGGTGFVTSSLGGFGSARVCSRKRLTFQEADSSRRPDQPSSSCLRDIPEVLFVSFVSICFDLFGCCSILPPLSCRAKDSFAISVSFWSTTPSTDLSSGNLSVISCVACSIFYRRLFLTLPL